MTMTMSPPQEDRSRNGVGWQRDPSDDTFLRYWNGSRYIAEMHLLQEEKAEKVTTKKEKCPVPARLQTVGTAGTRIEIMPPKRVASDPVPMRVVPWINAVIPFSQRPPSATLGWRANYYMRPPSPKFYFRPQEIHLWAKGPATWFSHFRCFWG